MDREVKIRLSLGLIAVVALHAVLTAGVFSGLHHRPADSGSALVDALQLPTYQPPTAGDRGRFPNPPTMTAPPDYGTNNPALNEVKKSGGTSDEAKGQNGRCIPCRPALRVPQPHYPTPAPYPPPTHYPLPTTPTPAAQPYITPTPTPPAKPIASARRHQIALFVDSSPEGQQLLQWWDTVPELVELKRKCEFQIYTPDNALYRTRYAEVVPVSQFPAILFLQPDGGHIHAAGGNMLPSNGAQLHADLAASYRLSQSVANAPGLAQSGALRERGYNWDNAMVERDRESQFSELGDCPPGELCPDDRPRILPRFFDTVDNKAAVLWAGGSEIAIVILTVAAIALIGVILYRRR